MSKINKDTTRVRFVHPENCDSRQKYLFDNRFSVGEIYEVISKSENYHDGKYCLTLIIEDDNGKEYSVYSDGTSFHFFVHEDDKDFDFDVYLKKRLSFFNIDRFNPFTLAKYRDNYTGFNEELYFKKSKYNADKLIASIMILKDLE